MSAKPEYRTVCEADPAKLDEKVNRLLAEGWSLYGNPYVAITEGNLFTTRTGFCQALLREPGAAAHAGVA